MSFVRWAGSKRLLLPQLKSLAQPGSFARYVEPFAGSAALFFALTPTRAVLADINHDLINMYRAVKYDVELVLECFRRLPRGEHSYYSLRATDVSHAAPSIQAATFLYLNRYCFNGLFRTNKSGQFNVPYGPPRQALVGFEAKVRAGALALRSADLLPLDFEQVIARVQPEDFVYLDPPYAVDERRIFREYLPGSFSTFDIPRLSAALRIIDAAGATFLLSYELSHEALALAQTWELRVVTTRRNVAGFASHRRSAKEVLISNRPLTPMGIQ